MKKLKRIMAALAAGVMAVTGMTMSASASSWSSYNLHYYPNIPSSQNVTVQIVGTSTNPIFSVASSGIFKMRANVSSMNCTSVTMLGQVYENISYVWGYVWSNADQRTINSTGYSNVFTKNDARAQKNFAERVQLTMNYNSSSISNSDGSVIAW